MDPLTIANSLQPVHPVLSNRVPQSFAEFDQMAQRANMGELGRILYENTLGYEHPGTPANTVIGIAPDVGRLAALRAMGLRGPSLSAETFRMSQVSGKAVKKLNPELRDVRREIGAVRTTRNDIRQPDPLIVRSTNRKRNLDWQRSRAQETAKLAAENARRDALLGAAREARKMGYVVRASKDRSGRISSYYITDPQRGGAPLRISDHEIPWTPQREAVAQAQGRGFYSGYHGNELLIDEAYSPEQLRKMISEVFK